MKKSKLILGALSALTFASMSLKSIEVKAGFDRPPQYILFAFDGSKSIDMWKETQDFAVTAAVQGAPVKFTYFINTAYYLTQANRAAYNSPEGGAGKSAIGFGGEWLNVANRFVETNKAYEAGHEIANHATGHWDGSEWSKNQWDSELTQFYDLLFQLTKYNSSEYPSGYESGWRLKKSDIRGFRAPQLGENAAMYSVLADHGIHYDTSLTDAPDTWPYKNKFGTWMHPLATIHVAGTNRKTLSMDYNFYFFQSGAEEVTDPSSIRKFEEQMYDSYLEYFKDNYNGNRAPVHIGHHFSKWNGGAYWNAMKRAVITMCKLKEVKCVTYSEYTHYLENLPAGAISAYRKGQFEKMRPYNPAPGPVIAPTAYRGVRGPRVWDARTMKAHSDPASAHE